MLEDGKFIIVWSLFGVGICVMLFVVTVLKRRHAEQLKWDPIRLAEERRLEEARSIEFRKLVKNNLARLPSAETPPLDPDWNAVNVFIRATKFQFSDKGDKFQYGDQVNYWDIYYISKSEFDGDSLKLIELLRKDVEWFTENPTGMTLSEEDEVLCFFLRKKYSGLSDENIGLIRLKILYYNK